METFDFNYDYKLKATKNYAVDVIEFENGVEQRRLIRSQQQANFVIEFKNKFKWEIDEILAFFEDRRGDYEAFYFLEYIYCDRLYYKPASTRLYEGTGSQAIWTLGNSPLYAPSGAESYITLRKVALDGSTSSTYATSAYTVDHIYVNVSSVEGGWTVGDTITGVSSSDSGTIVGINFYANKKATFRITGASAGDFTPTEVANDGGTDTCVIDSIAYAAGGPTITFTGGNEPPVGYYVMADYKVRHIARFENKAFDLDRNTPSLYNNILQIKTLPLESDF